MSHSDTNVASPPDLVDSVTQLLARAQDGAEPAAWERIYALLYEDLRRIARAQVRQLQAPGFSPTSLVSETWLKLSGAHISATDRRHLTVLIARAMRFVLLDEARRIHTAKRGDGVQFVPLEEALALPESVQMEQLLALGKALESLAELDERLARTVELRYFGGLTEPEIAQALGVTVRTVSRDWRKARAWLKTQLDTVTMNLVTTDASRSATGK